MASLPPHNAPERLVWAGVPSLEPFPITDPPEGGNGHTKVLEETLTLRPEASCACLSGVFLGSGSVAWCEDDAETHCRQGTPRLTPTAMTCQWRF